MRGIGKSARRLTSSTLKKHMQRLVALTLTVIPATLMAGESQPHAPSPDAFESFDVQTLGLRAPFEARFPELFDGSDDGCVGSDFEEESRLEVYEITPTLRSAAILCMPGAYNMLYTTFTASFSDGEWSWTSTPVTMCGEESPFVVNPYFDEETRELGFFEKGTGAGGCGTDGSMVWTETGWGAGWCRAWHDCDEPLIAEWPVTFGEAPPAHAEESDDTLPPAFTAEALADGIENGEHYVFQVDQPHGSSQTHMLFLDPTAEAVTVETWEIVDSEATAPVAAVVPWADLSEHGAYNTARTEVTDGVCRTGIGDLAGRHFVVQEHDGSVARACFADEYPGPPVRYILEVEGQPVFGMQLVTHTIADLTP